MKVDKENYESPVETPNVQVRLRPIDYFLIGVLFSMLLVILMLNFSQYKIAKEVSTTNVTTSSASYTAGDSQSSSNQTSEEAPLNSSSDYSEGSTSCSSVSSDSSASSNSSNITDSYNNFDSTDSSDNDVININTATKEELMELSGVGEVKAQNIIDYRNSYGPFTEPSQIVNVTGIGEKIFEKNKNRIVV